MIATMDVLMSLLHDDNLATSFPVAINKLIQGRQIARIGVKGTIFERQSTTEKSKMTKPYVYKISEDGKIPYTFTNEDIFAMDWVVI